MPIYEYYCKTCHDSFDVRQPMGEMVQEMSCPEGHAGAQKALSVFAAVVKADGSVSTAALPDTPCTPSGCARCN